MKKTAEQLIESDQTAEEILNALESGSSKNEKIEKGALAKLEGKTVRSSIIRNDGSVQIIFTDGAVLEFETEPTSLK